MAPVVPDPKAIKTFENAAAFEDWLSKSHGTARELWIRIYKKASGVATVTPAEALDVALCWGWIDGLRKSYDEASFLQRYTPRTPKSIWSQINRDHVARLVAAGRMTEHGLAEVARAKADGRWDAAYASPRTAQVPEDLLAAIAAKPRALRTYQTLNKVNRFALAFRVGRLKTPAGRAKKIADLVALLARGETPVPNGSPSAAKTTKPAPKTTKRGAESAKPVAESAKPVAESAKPVAESTKPVARSTKSATLRRSGRHAVKGAQPGSRRR